MARASKAKSDDQETRDPARAQRLRAILHCSIAVALLVACGAGYSYAHRYVERKLTSTATPPRIVLKNQPAWMSDSLAEEIASAVRPRTVSSATDHRVLENVVQILRRQPYVRTIKQVRRAFGRSPGDTIEIDCEYRAPVALVEWTDRYWKVDGEGVVLGESFSAAQLPRVIYASDGRVLLRCIEGIKSRPPVDPTDSKKLAAGQKWAGKDLVAALDMAKFLWEQPCAQEIEKINVANFAKRVDPREPQIVLVTKYQTLIRWGEPVRQDFYAELSPGMKLARLAWLRQEKGRVDANHSWIDIRFEKITIPSAEVPVMQASIQ